MTTGHPSRMTSLMHSYQRNYRNGRRYIMERFLPYQRLDCGLYGIAIGLMLALCILLIAEAAA